MKGKHMGGWDGKKRETGTNTSTRTRWQDRQGKERERALRRLVMLDETHSEGQVPK